MEKKAERPKGVQKHYKERYSTTELSRGLNKKPRRSRAEGGVSKGENFKEPETTE